MKLLILLVTLLVRTNPSSSMPTPNLNSVFKDVLGHLRGIHQELVGHKPSELKQRLTVFDQTVKIQTPQNIKNACECEALFVQQLQKALGLVDEVVPMDQIDNILDSLKVLHLPKNSSDSCNFTKHKLRDTSLTNMTQDYIQFIEHWNTKCKTKSHNRN